MGIKFQSILKVKIDTREHKFIYNLYSNFIFISEKDILMKKMILTVLSIGMFYLPNIQAQAVNSCKIVLCMAGAANGNLKVQGCQDAVIAFFVPTQRYTPYYNPAATAAARTNLLNTCPSADPADKAKIIMRYGTTPLDPSV